MNPKKIVRKVMPKRGVGLLESLYRRGRGLLWQVRYGFAGRKLRIIAVTGTNGKTTTISYINSVLQASEFKTAVYTTAYFEIDGKRTPNRTHMTVASQRSVQKFFADAKKAGVDYVVLEITSNALDQKRIAGINVEVAVMTNLTQDHLDYHGTMENYAHAKARLFSSEYKPKYAILNIDDEWYDFFAGKAVGKQFSYGTRSDATLQLTDHECTDSGSSFSFKYNDNTYNGKTKLMGLFNIYNSLAALSVAAALKHNMVQAIEGVERLSAVPGRMEEIDEGQDFKVLVDFAYTPDALLNALSSLQEITNGDVHIVFGATGDRDKGKRPLMGEVVAENADFIYLTDDETYSEDPKVIRDAVYEGIKRKRGEKKTKVFDDRLAAIKSAFKSARKGDVVLLAGIGHEDYRNMGGKKVPWDERQIARKELKYIRQ